MTLVGVNLWSTPSGAVSRSCQRSPPGTNGRHNALTGRLNDRTFHEHTVCVMALVARASLSLALGFAACARPMNAPPRTTEPPPMRTRDASDAVVSDATASTDCDASGYPTLTDYSEITDGRRFSLEMRREPGGAWVPIAQLRMPMHHASTIVFEPSLDTLVADAGAAQTWLVLATGLGRRSLEHDPRRHAWFATYAARPERVCPR